ncbi:MAG: hypothetical protein H0V70_18160 [Ktedonobacteraceae bacterium]|nr:hypothetical protein [Ktedonobacteraceae bacterium]
MSKSAGKLYVKEFSLAMGSYVIVMLVSVTLLNISPSGAWWRIPLALAPVVPALFALGAYMRFFSRMDELQRRIQSEALAFGFASAGILTFSYGFLENVGLPRLSWIFVFPLMIAMWGIGVGIAARRYQ